MPALDGLGVARALGPQGPRVVFVTACDDFALAAFDSAAVDYLVKPVTEERLQKTLARLGEPARAFLLETLEGAGSQAAEPACIAVKSGGEYHFARSE